MTSLLSQPLAAAAAGVVTGALLLLASRTSSRALTPANAERGLALAAVALLGRLGAATVVLWAFHRWVPGTFAAFGLALVGAFLVLYSVELVRFAGLHRYARPNPGSGTGGR